MTGCSKHRGWLLVVGCQRVELGGVSWVFDDYALKIKEGG